MRVKEGAEGEQYPRTEEGGQGERPVVNEDQFEASVRVTHSVNETEWSKCDHPLDPQFLRVLCPRREALIGR